MISIPTNKAPTASVVRRGIFAKKPLRFIEINPQSSLKLGLVCLRACRNRELADLADDVSFAAGLRRGEEGKEVRIHMAARVGDAAALRRALDEAALVVADRKSVV